VPYPNPNLEWYYLVIIVDSSYMKLLSVTLRWILHLLPDETPAVMAEDIAWCKRCSYIKECLSTWDLVYGICKCSHWRYQSRATYEYYVTCGCGWDIWKQKLFRCWLWVLDSCVLQHFSANFLVCHNGIIITVFYWRMWRMFG